MHSKIAVVKWVDVSKDEARVFLGIVILIALGIHKLRIIYRS